MAKIHTHTATEEIKPIRGRLRGRPVLRIDLNIGPPVKKRFTTGDLLHLLCYDTKTLNTQTLLKIIWNLSHS